MTRRETAENYFKEGYNCAQSVVLAFADLLGKDKDELAMLASSFGGGMGRLREVCGAVSGMAIVAGLLKGYSNPKDHEAKSAHYAFIQELAGEFKAQNGSIICRELLEGVQIKADTAPTPEKRTEGYYSKRPCVELVGMAVEILEHKIL